MNLKVVIKRMQLQFINSYKIVYDNFLPLPFNRYYCTLINPKERVDLGNNLIPLEDLSLVSTHLKGQISNSLHTIMVV